MNKNRSQEEIIADILAVVTKGPRKTHIMYGANLSYMLLCRYLDKLIAGGLIVYSENTKVYELTHRGEAYLCNYADYKRLKEQWEADKYVINEKEIILNMMLEANNS